MASSPAAALLCASLLLSTAAKLTGDSRTALQRAAELVQQGRLDEADQQARLALSDPQTRAVACSVLGTIRFQQKRLKESADFLQEAIRLEPRLVGARLSLAEVYTLQQKPELAFGLFRQVLKLDPSNASARLALARSEAEKGNYRQSLEFAKPALPALRQSADGLLVLATDYISLDDRVGTAGLASDWIKMENIAPAWSIRFALLLAKGGIVPEAIDVLENAKHNQPVSYDLAFNLAGMYLLKNDTTHALENYDLAITRNPVSVAAFRQAATVAEGHGELERALSYWMKAKKLEPENPEILLGFGRVCLKMDLLDDAETALTRAAGLRPDDPSYQYTLASAKVGKKQFEVAQSILEGLITKQPQDAHLHYALGSVLYLEGHLNEAATHLRESVRLQPDQQAAYYYSALVARDQGREAEAIRLLEELLRRYPDHALSCEVLGGMLMSAHRYSEAQKSLQKAISLNPQSVKANYQLGLLLARMGEKDESDKQLRLAHSLRVEDETNSRLQLRLLDPDR
ncbi:MAG: hypothetical protein DMG77_14050 [Acidobacteria bacterium]|nr:MAG: hypothetical protein DMG77_14050 [Acidobacteriota bacterium]